MNSETANLLANLYINKTRNIQSYLFQLNKEEQYLSCNMSHLFLHKDMEFTTEELKLAINDLKNSAATV